VDIAAFLERAPEFRTFVSTAPNGTARVQAALDSATRRTDASVFGADTDDAIFFLAAHLLAASPSGKDARLKGEAFESLYLAERRRLEAIYAPLLANAAASPLVLNTWCDEW
jgi:hypothetical protein